MLIQSHMSNQEGKLLANPLALGKVDLIALEACRPAVRAAIEDL